MHHFRHQSGTGKRRIDRQVRSRVQQGLLAVEVDAQRLTDLRPDLILALDSDKILASLPRNAEILQFKPARIIDLWADIQRVADALGISETGRELLSPLKNRLVDIIAKTCMIKHRPKVACIEWIEPLIAAGHWIPELVEFAGGHDVFSKPGSPATTLEWTTLVNTDPDIIVFMACGFDLARTRRELKAVQQRSEWRKLHAVRSNKVFITDASQFFTRPGPRLVESLEMLAGMVNPALFHFDGEGKTGEGKTWERVQAM